MSKGSLDRWTQSTVYYLLVPITQKLGIEVSRRYITNLIRGVAEELGTTRERLQIIASPRAVMYHDGDWTSVSFDAIKTLASKGTDIIFIEKLDIVDVFTEYADKYGIALVNSQGHLTDYGKALVREAKETDGHVAIFTDHDASGYKMWKDIPTEIPRLGVDQEMLDYFGLDKNNESIRIVDPPPENQINPIRNAKEAVERKTDQDKTAKDKAFEDIDLDFLNYYKIEIDAVLAVVGSKRLWQYLMDRLVQHYKIRDYTKVIDIEKVISTEKLDLSEYYPEALWNFQTYIEDHVRSIIEEDREKIETELKKVEGVIDVPEKKELIKKQLGEIVEKDQHLKDLALNVEKMIKKAGLDITKFKPQPKPKQ